LIHVRQPASFLVIALAYEQTHKAQGVLADASWYARALSRTLVEPAVQVRHVQRFICGRQCPGTAQPPNHTLLQDSRIISPWASRWRGLSLSDYWTLETFCATTPTIRLRPFLRYARAMGLNRSRADLHIVSGLHEPLRLRGMAAALPTGAEAEAVRAYFRRAVSASQRKPSNANYP